MYRPGERVCLQNVSRQEPPVQALEAAEGPRWASSGRSNEHHPSGARRSELHAWRELNDGCHVVEPARNLRHHSEAADEAARAHMRGSKAGLVARSTALLSAGKVWLAQPSPARLARARAPPPPPPTHPPTHTHHTTPTHPPTHPHPTPPASPARPSLLPHAPAWSTLSPLAAATPPVPEGREPRCSQA